MNFMNFGVIAVTSLMVCTAANAKDFQLVCAMNTNIFGAREAGLESIVPAHATHVVEALSTEITEISMAGRATDVGSRIKLKYSGALEDVGDIDISYTFIKATGAMIARTQAIRSTPWYGMQPPEKSGEFLVNGHCVMK